MLGKWLLGAATLVIAQGAHATDECAAVLAGGAQDSIVLQSRHQYASEATDFFCSDKFRSFVENNKGGFGLTLPIEGVPVTFGGDSRSDRAFTQRDTFCAKAERRLAEDASLALAVSVTSKARVDAWLACHGLKSELGRLKISDVVKIETLPAADGRFLVLRASWTPVPFSAEPSFVRLHLSSGLTCQPMAPNAKIPTSGLSTLCERTSDDAQTIALEAKANESTLFTSHSLPARRCGKPYGRYSVVETRERIDWVPAGKKKVTRETGNHHCSRNCDGEPTRTNYRMELTASDGESLANPKLQCIGGPCGGWHHVYFTENDGPRRVHASFDVWSKPTSWLLSADLFKREVRTESESSAQATELVYGNTFVVPVSVGARSATLLVKTAAGSEAALPVDGQDHGELRWIATSKDGQTIRHTYRIACD